MSLFRNLGEDKARPLFIHPSACPTGPCRRGGRAWRLSNLLKEEEKEEEKEENTEGDDDKKWMEGKKRDEEDMTWHKV